MTGKRYQAVPAQVDLPALDRVILDFWRDNRVFERSLEQSAGGPEWVFYEGPPTANGMPGAHHIETRVFKDVFPRHRTMKGFSVARMAGWDCHGLPVELAVEKELGFTGKQDIEAYGIAEFNQRCRESVGRYTQAFVELTHRMGYWIDMDDAYWTMSPQYIESVWWSLRRIFDQGLLVEDFRVAPWCPRCETGLSEHELAQGYETVVDPSVYVRFPLTSGPLAGEASLLVWTTTPWTLVSNVAVAVHPDVNYVVATDGSESLVVAESLVERALGQGWASTGRTLVGRDMQGWTYQRPFDLVDIDGAAAVVPATYVTTQDGTGLVHLAPAFGADDFAVSRTYGLPMVNPVRSDGTFEPELALVGGVFFKAADELLVADLDARGRLLRREPYEHTYPHCWRCHTPLMYYAQPSWYIRTTAVRAAMLRENERTSWQPGTIKEGRYGDWLRNNVDWALSRSRYWGTPLPIWRCGDGHLTCVGSLAELGELAGEDLTELDPHRPYVDDVTVRCQCGNPARRVPEVIDVWYDSGAMPFAQYGYPQCNVELFERRYPAQFIAEAIDQTRGWFYTLMAVGTLVFDRSAYENVVCLGLILAEDGRRMSKHLGNIIEPIGLLDRHGADAVRWFMAASGSPWSARRIGSTTLQDVVRRVLLTYWNTVAFQALYGRASGWSPSDEDPAPVDRPLLDRWLLSELAVLVREVDAALDRFDPHDAGRRLSTFIDDLSNWYVRRSRRRFWHGDPAALATLHQVLETVTRLMAPITPFITERVWQDLVVPVTPGAPASVHLATYPVVDDASVDAELSIHMRLARRVVEVGRSARAASGIRTRQPLATAIVAGPGVDALPAELRAQVAAELNVRSVTAGAPGSLVDTTAKANFRALGQRFGQRVQAVATAIAAADATKLSDALRGEGSAMVTVDGESVTLHPDEVVVTQAPRRGWAFAQEAGVAVALDLTVTPELRRAGIAREAIRQIQEARKASGLQVTDRIVLRYETSDPTTAQALTEHADLVADEVLAADFGPGRLPGRRKEFRDDSRGVTFWLRKSRVG